jgi:hypothetical protein
VHAGQPAAHRAAHKEADRLQRVVNTQRGTACVHGRQSRGQAGLAGFESVEADEKHKHQQAQRPQTRCGPAAARGHPPQTQLHQRNQANGRQKHAAQLAAPLHGKQHTAHDHQRSHHGGQIHLPVVHLGQPGLHQQRGHRHPHGELHGMQHKNAQVQAQQTGVAQRFAQTTAHLAHVGRLVHHRLGRCHPDHHRDTDQRQRTRERENTGQTNARGQQRRQHQ